MEPVLSLLLLSTTGKSRQKAEYHAEEKACKTWAQALTLDTHWQTELGQVIHPCYVSISSSGAGTNHAEVEAKWEYPRDCSVPLSTTQGSLLRLAAAPHSPQGSTSPSEPPAASLFLRVVQQCPVTSHVPVSFFPQIFLSSPPQCSSQASSPLCSAFRPQSSITSSPRGLLPTPSLF